MQQYTCLCQLLKSESHFSNSQRLSWKCVEIKSFYYRSKILFSSLTPISSQAAKQFSRGYITCNGLIFLCSNIFLALIYNTDWFIHTTRKAKFFRLPRNFHESKVLNQKLWKPLRQEHCKEYVVHPLGYNNVVMQNYTTENHVFQSQVFSNSSVYFVNTDLSKPSYEV